MRFKSEAQRKKFQELVKQGKMDKSVLELYEKGTGNRKLPERLTPKKKKDAIS